MKDIHVPLGMNFKIFGEPLTFLFSSITRSDVQNAYKVNGIPLLGNVSMLIRKTKMGSMINIKNA